MAKKQTVSPAHLPAQITPNEPSSFLKRALTAGLGLLCVLVSVSFYTGTYDTALVKLTLLQLGGTALIALWLARLAAERRWFVTRQNWVLYLPFLLYYGWSLLSYLWLPYKAEAFEEFSRCGLYFLLTLAVLSEFRLSGAQKLARCMVWAAWISFIYGLVQVLDRYVPGVDLMPWRAFFNTRVFSTHANPNFFADFVVFSNFIVLAEYLRTRAKSLLALFALGLVNLFFTESKGAWIGFAASGAFFVMLYANSFSAALRKHLRKVNATACVLLLAACVLVGVYAAKRFQSVSFRAHTWVATAQMVQDSPFIGTGVGSFRIIYPAYRKPQIFYIEKQHNTETQHPENEYLEQWATTGSVGLVLFLGLLFFVLYIGIRNVRALNALTEQRGAAKISNRAWLLLGYLTAFFGILVHNFFDISMRFASTGLFFAIFSALIVCLARPDELDKPESAAERVDGEVRPAVDNRHAWAVWAARLACAAGTVLFCAWLMYLFRETVGNLGMARTMGSALLRVIAWFVFGGVVLLGAWAYLRAAFLSRIARVPLILLLSLPPMYMFYGFFQSDHYYGIAVEFVNRRQYDGALDYYQKAIHYNPWLSAYYQYRGNLLRATMDMSQTFAPKKGDTDGPMNDYQRIVRDYSKVQQMAPNHSLIYQNWGEFYYSAAVMYSNLAAGAKGADFADYKARALDNMERAKESFKRSLLIDPVNENTYRYLISIAMLERDEKAAREYIELYRQGPAGVTEKEFLDVHRNNPTITAQERALLQLPFAKK